jgi:hypothetical protein
MKVIRYDRRPRQHVIYGPSASIAQKITPDNWQEVAILRCGQYVYIARGYRNWEEGKNWRYFVEVSPNHDLKSDFAELDDAIEYAHSLGEPGTKLPFERSSGTYVGVKFGNVREGIEIPLKRS